MKKFKKGFYGGKFIPFHRGHLYCIEMAAQECEELHVIIFINGDDEDKIRETFRDNVAVLLSQNARFYIIKKTLAVAPNIHFHVIDCKNCRLPDGSEDWDTETPLVLNEIGMFDAVYSSEPSYDAYFKRAYPWAVHRCLDPERNHVPISATEIRNFLLNGERKEVEKWAII